MKLTLKNVCYFDIKVVKTLLFEKMMFEKPSGAESIFENPSGAKEVAGLSIGLICELCPKEMI